MNRLDRPPAPPASIALLLLFVPTAGASAGDPVPAPLPEYRTVDGTRNNLQHPTWGSANVPLLRFAVAGYEDDKDVPSGEGRPSAREISNALCNQKTLAGTTSFTDFVWQWGQFLDHDLDLSPTLEPAEPMDIDVPAGDPEFDPQWSGSKVIPMSRSFYVKVKQVREQINEITAYIDASNVYGSDEERARWLRTMDGTGRLKTSPGDLMPYNVDALPNAPAANDPSFFLAGDFRANEQNGLTALHTLFVREHNYWADLIRGAQAAGAPSSTVGRSHPERPRLTREEFQRRQAQQEQLDGGDIYLLARAIVGAEMQVITYRDFLPILLGPNALEPYAGYRPDVDASIANEFSTAAYRVGHSMLSPTLLRLDANLQPIPAGNLPLAHAFFQPGEIASYGIEPLLRGLAHQRIQDVDTHVVDDVRNFLFGPPGAGGFDLASLNIQRGRDHGLASYNRTRFDYGLPERQSFSEITTNSAHAAKLAALYGDVDEVDLWPGGLSEDHLPGALVGETFHAILKRQFEALRDGDRFWYQNYLPAEVQALVESQTLADIIRRNTSIADEIPDDVFRMP